MEYGRLGCIYLVEFEGGGVPDNTDFLLDQWTRAQVSKTWSCICLRKINFVATMSR